MADTKVTSYGMRRTLGHLAQHQLTLWMHWRKCRRAAKLDVRQMVETRGVKIDMKEVLASYICENCGAVWPLHRRRSAAETEKEAAPRTISLMQTLT